jgi:hypothetical protein
MNELKAQTIWSSGRHLKRTVTHVKTSWGTETGRVTLYGSIYKVMRMVGENQWQTTGSPLHFYPAGHPLESLNPKD